EDGDTYAAEAAKAREGEESKYISDASENSQINEDCIISGNFTEESARTLANLINSGSLPVKLTELSSNVVSASYGADALRVTALAGVLGVAVVMLVMILVYRLPGLISAIMLAFYVWAVFGIYSLMGAVFTLSGIGALVLGIGMTVDANIINYERIRQELYKGRSVRAAVAEGGKLSFGAVFDAQLTTLIAALIMYIWGTGTVKGFATMLIITVVMTLLLNVGFSKRLLNLIVDSGVCDNKPGLFAVKKNQIPNVSKGEKQFYTGTHHLDYMGKAKYAVGISSLIVIVALCLSLFNLSKGNGFFNLGIDFASGTKLTVTSENTVEVSDVQATLESLGYDDFSFQSSGDSTVYATTKASLDKQQLTEIKSAFEEKYGVEPGDNIVTPVVGAELVRSAIILTVVAWIAMLGYISFRYEFDYALGCLVALVHDVLIVLAIFSILRLEVNIELISVLLTIIGYSINNSIIVFDRVREVVRSRHNIDPSEYRTIANDAIDEAIKMSVISSITTLIPVIFLLVMGSNSIFTFVFAMLVGLIAGTVSSIFIAAYLWCIIRIHSKPKQRNKKHTKAKKEKKEALDEYTITGINA
ncbi:MAG: protein translocase subunit SecF, partial [Bulleidia sp.]|nr:protein translocase subunit SecF [Bulleidia sp.]